MTRAMPALTHGEERGPMVVARTMTTALPQRGSLG